MNTYIQIFSEVVRNRQELTSVMRAASELSLPMRRVCVYVCVCVCLNVCVCVCIHIHTHTHTHKHTHTYIYVCMYVFLGGQKLTSAMRAASELSL